MSTMHTHLDPTRLQSLAQDPDYGAAEVAMAALRKAQAALQSKRDCQIMERDPLDHTVMTNCTSLQPLGDAQVMVCYDENNHGLYVVGVDLDSGFVYASEFAAHVVARWERDIEIECRKAAEIDRWEA